MADDLKPLDGKTTIDEKVMFEAQRLSYDSSRIIADKIAFRISERTRTKQVVIANTQFLADVSNLVATKAILAELAKDYDALAKQGHPAHGVSPVLRTTSRGHGFVGLETALSPTLAAATAGVQSALALVSLFRSDVDYKGVATSIDALSFEIELASRVRMHKAAQVIVPDLAVLATPAATDGSLLPMLDKVKSRRDAALQALAPKDTHSLPHDPKPGAAPKKDEGSNLYVGSVDVHAREPMAEPLAAELAHIDQRFTDLQGQLAKGDADAAGLTILARLLRAESIVARGPTYVHARVVVASGSNRVKHSLWSSIIKGDGLSSSGGAVVTWAVLNANGAVEDGGVFSHSMSAASPKPTESQPSHL